MSDPGTHQIELNVVDRDLVRILAERGPLSSAALSRELHLDLRLVDRSVLKLLHNGLLTVDGNDVCALTSRGAERVPKLSSGSFRERLNRVL
ncbi:MAG: hypothetical protein ACUVYA_18330 [Planctomycetota bacterium]